MFEMTDKELIALGFKEYPPTRFDSDGIEGCFQKRYDDDKGKKYFININKWKEWRHPHTNEVEPPNYEYTSQLYKKNGHDPLNLLFHSSWTLEDVEKYMEALWNTGLFEHYEEF